MATNTSSMYENNTTMTHNLIEGQGRTNIDIMVILQNIIASLGTVANFTVVIVFLNDRKLRCKIPNMFIIYQVRQYRKYYSSVEHWSVEQSQLQCPFKMHCFTCLAVVKLVATVLYTTKALYGLRCPVVECIPI